MVLIQAFGHCSCVQSESSKINKRELKSFVNQISVEHPAQTVTIYANKGPHVACHKAKYKLPEVIEIAASRAVVVVI